MGFASWELAGLSFEDRQALERFAREEDRRKVAAAAQAEADAQAAVKAEEDRAFKARIDEALELARGAHRGQVPDDILAELVHLVRLASRAPAIRLLWVLPTTMADEVMRRDRNAVGLAFLHDGSREVLVPSPRSRAELRTLAHEIGHQRDGAWRGASAFQLEVHAWRWTSEHMLEWTDADTARVREALQHNSEKAGVDPRHVLEGQHLIRDLAGRPNRRITSADVTRAKADFFEAEHGPQTCRMAAACDDRAVALYNTFPACARCHERAVVDDDLASLKAMQRRRALPPAPPPADVYEGGLVLNRDSELVLVSSPGQRRTYGRAILADDGALSIAAAAGGISALRLHGSEQEPGVRCRFRVRRVNGQPMAYDIEALGGLPRALDWQVMNARLAGRR